MQGTIRKHLPGFKGFRVAAALIRPQACPSRVSAGGARFFAHTAMPRPSPHAIPDPGFPATADASGAASLAKCFAA